MEYTHHTEPTRIELVANEIGIGFDHAFYMYVTTGISHIVFHHTTYLNMEKIPHSWYDGRLVDCALTE